MNQRNCDVPQLSKLEISPELVEGVRKIEKKKLIEQNGVLKCFASERSISKNFLTLCVV